MKKLRTGKPPIQPRRTGKIRNVEQKLAADAAPDDPGLTQKRAGIERLRALGASIKRAAAQ